VCPGFTDTEMLRAHVPDVAVRATLGARTTIGRLIEPSEIADVIVFCIEHPVVNGAVLHANLGQIEA
jgi:3-oxoacyl-[acyl-carrier protein] reductase